MIPDIDLQTALGEQRPCVFAPSLVRHLAESPTTRSTTVQTPSVRERGPREDRATPCHAWEPCSALVNGVQPCYAIRARLVSYGGPRVAVPDAVATTTVEERGHVRQHGLRQTCGHRSSEDTAHAGAQATTVEET